MNRNPSQTKIVATIGPASASTEILRKLILEGVDVCRLNFSHGTREEHLKVIQRVLELNRELNTDVAILADLQGPKIRIGEVENNKIELKEGNEITIVTEPCLGTANQLYISYREFPQDVKKGDSILLDDGKLKFEVISTNLNDKVTARVVFGGSLSSRKGVNLPDTRVSSPSLTEKDINDAIFALENGADWIALSFVRSASDLIPLKDLITQHRKSAGMIAKIEKPEALQDIDAIIGLADGIMVARGDLGVEVPFDRVPLIQKDLVSRCIAKAKPVIVATQMLESMITAFRPTRAEANDVANAVFDGADALMLSAETSAGKYPVEAVHAMQRIITWSEKGFHYTREILPDFKSPAFLPDSICLNACRLANQTNARAIVTFTNSGYTALRISGYRPKASIYAFTRNKTMLRKLSLAWGVKAFYFEGFEKTDDAIGYSTGMLKARGMLDDNDVVVHAGSTPLEEKGQTNMIKLSYV